MKVLSWMTAILMVSGVAMTEAQTLLRSEPADGAKNVPLDIGEVRFHFDRDMNTGGWSFLVTKQGKFPPPEGNNRKPWMDARCCRLRIGKLEPGTTYALQLNSSRKKGFSSARTGKPLPVTVVRFTTVSPEANPGSKDAAGRPPCPEGWQPFSNDLLGLHAHVPPGFFVRMRGRSALSVERTDGQPTAAFLVPLRPRGTTTPEKLATNFIRFCSKQDSNYRGRILEGGTATRVKASYTTEIAGKKVEGRFLAVMAAGGTMAYVIGVCAPRGRLERELPLLNRVAKGFAFSRPAGRWKKYRTPSLSMTVPAGWTVSTTEGRVAKNESDWEVFDPRNPQARAFSITPKFCTAYMMNIPLYPMRGYKVATFRSPEQCIRASINQLYRGARVTSVKPNAFLTRVCRQLFGSVNRNLSGLQAGGLDIGVFDCLAEARDRGRTIQIAFCCAISQLNLGTGVQGPMIQTDVWCRGWCAPQKDFLNASPVLDRIQDSMQYSLRYIKRVHKAEGERAKILHDTQAEMARLDREMNRKHWDTVDAIAEMYHDHWTEMGGYVNRNTGRIEQMKPEDLIKNSRGDIVSRQEVQAGVDPEEATVLRDAWSADYMRGVYGRIEFL